uniref:Uncharacterized protein n=1 Tax=Tetranychus urticae TaxID=32264 RepID=T1JT37_TETUR
MFAAFFSGKMKIFHKISIFYN